MSGSMLVELLLCGAAPRGTAYRGTAYRGTAIRGAGKNIACMSKGLCDKGDINLLD